MKLLFLIGFLILIIIIGIWYNTKNISEGFSNDEESDSIITVSEKSESFDNTTGTTDTSPPPPPTTDTSPPPPPTTDTSPPPPPPSNTVPTTPVPMSALEKYNQSQKLSGITQIGGEGPNNYFHPNIIIRRKTPTQPPQIQQPQIQQNPNTMLSYSQEINSAYYDNSGYNISNNDSSASSNYDSLDSGARNAATSYQAELDQTGVCLDCVENNSADAINYSGSYDDFDNVDPSMVYDPTLYDMPRPPTAPNYRQHTDSNNQLNNSPGFVHSCKMKKFVPGYQIQPPKCWDMPQKRPPVCLSTKKQLPAAVFDRGTPLNALDLDTSVGSIMPKFQYNELPRNA